MLLKKTFMPLLLVILLSGCATGGLFGDDTADEPVNPYFTSEFSDIQLPNDLK